MTKFKVGDQVRVITEGDDTKSSHGFSIGAVRKINRVAEWDKNFTYRLSPGTDDESFTPWVSEEDIELYVEKDDVKEPNPESAYNIPRLISELKGAYNAASPEVSDYVGHILERHFGIKYFFDGKFSDE